MLELAPALILALASAAPVAPALSSTAPGGHDPLHQQAAPTEPALTVSSTGLAACFSDPRDTGLARVLAAVEDRLGEHAARDEGARIAHAVWRLLQHPFVLRAGGTAEAPWLQLTSYPGGRTQARASSARLRSQLARHGLEVETSGGAHRAQTSSGELRFGVLGEGEELTFFAALGGYRPEPVRPGAAGEGGLEAALHVSWDGPGCGTLLERALEGTPGADAVLDWLGARGLLGAGTGGRLELRLEGTGGTLDVRRAAGVGRELLSASALARLPFGAPAATAFTVRPLKLLGLVDASDPGSARELELELGEATGVSLTALLRDLGPSAGAFTSSVPGGGPGALVLFVETGHPVEVGRSLATLVEGLLETSGGRLAVREFDHEGIECISLAFPGMPVPLEPSIAVAGGALYLAGHSASLREALDQLSAERSLLEHPRVAGAPGGDRTEGLQSFTFFDTPRFLNSGYGQLMQLVPMLENMARSSSGLGRDVGPLLPALPELAAGSRAWVGRSWLEGDELVRVASFDRSTTAQLVAFAGSPLFRSLGVGASVAIPSLMAARIRANERAAVSSLRAIASAQARFAEGGFVDVDADGEGEYGYLGELCGARPPRDGGRDPIEPLVSRRLAPTDDRGQGVAIGNGYVYQVFLGTRQGRTVVGLPESMKPGHASSPNADGATRYWCAYAWPLQQGETGVRAFAVNQDGEVRFLYSSPYSGLASEGGRVPRYDAAYERAGDMTSAFAAGHPAVDGNHWTPADAAR